MTMGQMCRQFLTKLDWFSTLFPRIPVPIQKSIEQRLNDYDRKNGIANSNQRQQQGTSDERVRERDRPYKEHKEYQRDFRDERKRSRSPPAAYKDYRDDRKRSPYDRKDYRDERKRSRSPYDSKYSSREKHSKKSYRDRSRERDYDRRDRRREYEYDDKPTRRY